MLKNLLKKAGDLIFGSDDFTDSQLELREKAAVAGMTAMAYTQNPIFQSSRRREELLFENDEAAFVIQNMSAALPPSNLLTRGSHNRVLQSAFMDVMVPQLDAMHRIPAGGINPRHDGGRTTRVQVQPMPMRHDS